MPRTGTTLVERILTGLADVTTNGETEHFSRSLLDATPPGSADIFERAAHAPADAVAAAYARRADGPGPQGKIIEKLPMNYLYVGAIRRALPQANIVLLRRSPLDSCFAMYRTLFREAYPFSYDFEDLARYYAAYERLMSHWRSLLGEQLIEVVYEDLVRAASAGRRAGAPVWPYMVGRGDQHSEQRGRVADGECRADTPTQYGTSSGRWRYYQAHLQGLIEALRRHGITT